MRTYRVRAAGTRVDREDGRLVEKGPTDQTYVVKANDIPSAILAARHQQWGNTYFKHDRFVSAEELS